MTFHSFGYSQSMTEIERKMLKYQFVESIELLEKVIEKDGKFSTIAKGKIADCYRHLNKPDSAIKYYKNLLEEDSTQKEAHFYYAMMLRNIGDYEKAQAEFLHYDSLVPDNKLNAALYAEYCEDIIPKIGKKGNYRIENLRNVNTEFADFSPIVYRDDLIFTSDKPREDKKGKTYGWTGNSYLNLYSSKLKAEGNIDSFIADLPNPFYDQLNSDYHDGSASFSSDFNTIYFTRTIKEKAGKGDYEMPTIVLKIYKSNYENGEWTEPEPFYLNNKEYSVGHPSLSVDGKHLYFVSDMPGGIGGTDLYVCELKNGNWTNVRNLGIDINTEGNEMFPYVDFKNNLYFASNGRLGYGGLDLYSVESIDDQWQEAILLDPPLNTSYDDFGLSFLNEKKGFLSSNRPQGKGNDDIYAFEMKVPLLLCGRVISDSGFVLQEASVFVWNESNQEVLVLKTDSLGKFCTKVKANTSYTILAKKMNFIDDCQQINIEEESANIPDLVLPQIWVDKVFVIENIYYDLDKWFIREDAEAPLNEVVRILKEHPIKIELSSHTDCRASHNYNERLSQRRAESAVNYIISQGIDATRITAKGYGETQLVNECEDGVNCTEEQHQMNRRTEFKIIEMEMEPKVIIDPLDSFTPNKIYQKASFNEDFFNACK